MTVKDCDADASKKYVYVDGGPEETKAAIGMVKQFIQNRTSSAPGRGGPSSLGPHNYKTRMCEKYLMGQCTYGTRCHFAHGAEDLKEPGMR